MIIPDQSMRFWKGVRCCEFFSYPITIPNTTNKCCKNGWHHPVPSYEQKPSLWRVFLGERAETTWKNPSPALSAAIRWTISVFGAFSDSCPRMNLKRMFLPTIKIQRFMVREWLELFDAAISWKFKGIKEKATAPAPLLFWWRVRGWLIHHHPALFRFQQVEKPSAKNVPCALPCNLRCNRKQEDVLLMTEWNDLMEVPRSSWEIDPSKLKCVLLVLQPPDSEDYADTQIGFTIHASLFVPCYRVLLWPLWPVVASVRPIPTSTWPIAYLRSRTPVKVTVA